MRISYTELLEETIPVIKLLRASSDQDFQEFPNLNKFVSRHGVIDAFLCPHNLNHLYKNPKYLEKIKVLSQEKPIIVFNLGDFPKKQPKGNFIFLQYSHEVGFRFDDRTVIVPYSSKAIPTTQRSLKSFPTISFVGQIPELSIGRIIRSVLPLNPSPLLPSTPHPISRNSALVRKLGARKIMELNGVVVRRLNHGGVLNTAEEANESRKLYEFVVQNSDLIFCPRGDGNNSLRLYESISSGRIPIVPRTGILMPYLFDHSLDRNYISTGPSSKDFEESVSNFWSSLSESEYGDRQERLKELYVRELRFKTYLERIFSLNTEELKTLHPKKI